MEAAQLRKASWAHLVASWLVAAFSPTPPSCCSSAPYAFGTLSAAACSSGAGMERASGHRGALTHRAAAPIECACLQHIPSPPTVPGMQRPRCLQRMPQQTDRLLHSADTAQQSSWAHLPLQHLKLLLQAGHPRPPAARLLQLVESFIQCLQQRRLAAANR